MKINFLGSGGGRFATISQRRMTGGFRIDGINGKNYHFDPGPGALVRSFQFGLVPGSLDGVFVSHAHTDHYTDAEILIEAMTRGMTKEKGVIVGNKSVIEGYENWGPCISNYHKSNSQNYMIEPGVSRIVDDMVVTGTKAIHGDPTTTGFNINTGDLVISYTSDTNYFEDLSFYHEDADILIASVIRPGTSSIRGHMCTSEFIDLVKEVKPQLAIMTHFGFKMLNSNPIKEARIVNKKTGIKTLAATDGLSIDINMRRIYKSHFTQLKLKDDSVYQRENSDFGNIFPDIKRKVKQESKKTINKIKKNT